MIVFVLDLSMIISFDTDWNTTHLLYSVAILEI